MTIGWAQNRHHLGPPHHKCDGAPPRATRTSASRPAATSPSACPTPSSLRRCCSCGTESGRTTDKFRRVRVSTAVPSAGLKSPTIAECGLCYECQVVNHADFVPEHLLPEVCAQCYNSGDYHRIYFGQILKVVADENVAEEDGRGEAGGKWSCGGAGPVGGAFSPDLTQGLGRG